MVAAGRDFALARRAEAKLQLALQMSSVDKEDKDLSAKASSDQVLVDVPTSEGAGSQFQVDAEPLGAASEVMSNNSFR